MAELHVQRKRNNSGWIWILLILALLAGAVIYYMNYRQKNDHALTRQDSVTNGTDTARYSR